MKTYLLLFFLVLSFTCSAQTQRGALMIGGSGEAYFDDAFIVNIKPSIGFFVLDNLAVGTGLPLFYGRSENNNSMFGSNKVIYKTTAVAIEPFVRYYFNDQAPLRVFAQANGSLSYRVNSNNAAKLVKSSENEVFYGGSMGFAYFLSQNIALEASAYYLKGNSVIPTGVDGPILFHSPQGAGLSIGIQFHIPRRLN